MTFDEYFSKNHSGWYGHGTVTERIARETWEAALKSVQQGADKPPDNQMPCTVDMPNSVLDIKMTHNTPNRVFCVMEPNAKLRGSGGQS